MSDRTEITYFFERLRAIGQGILETGAHTFLLLIAVRWFEAGAIAKALVAGAGSVGLMLSPVVVTRVEAGGWRVSRAAAVLLATGAACLLAMAALPQLPVYVLGSIIAMACASASIPLMTQVYQENYPGRQRGRRFSRTVIIRIGTAALFAEVAGRALSGHMEKFRLLLLVFAGAFAFSSWCASRVPSSPLTASGGSHPLRALRFAKSDPIFRNTLVAWMFMGFGNLMMFPMRVEYLANPDYGVRIYGQLLDAGTIALLTAVIPNLARLVLSLVWGWLFDHMNFFMLRAVLNLGFAAGILSFFMSDSLAGLILGAVIFGASNAGGDVAWSLWVTKFAPPDRVADYMSVHTFFTGIRGALAPLVGFQLVGICGMHQLGFISVGLILISVVLLLREIPWGRSGRAGEPLVEEVSE